MLKQVVMISCCVVLTACETIPQTFDNVGYNNVVVLKQSAEEARAACGSDAIMPAVDKLQRNARFSELYYTGKREDTMAKKSVATIKRMVDDLHTAYQGKPSVTYCTMQTEMIDDSIAKVMTVTGDRRQ